MSLPDSSHKNTPTLSKLRDPKSLRLPARWGFICLAAFGAITCLPVPAMAYVGPGAGLSAIGTLIAVIGAVLLAIVGFVWYPIKRLLKARKAPDAPDTPEPTDLPDSK